jgi:D-glycero-D-manno-heptose 1,7-bisphosphate phosphatase
VSRAAVFLDRDGTVTCEKGYINHVDRLALYPRSAQAIKRLNDAGVPVVLATNQAGVARGYFPFELVDKVHARLGELLAEQGARLDGIYFCPHLDGGKVAPYNVACNCRKPGTGLIERATADLDLDPTASFMVGDKISDVALGKKFGGCGVMVRTGYGRGEYEYFRDTWTVEPDFTGDDLFDVVEWILKQLGIAS